jgi:hypothetical protein
MGFTELEIILQRIAENDLLKNQEIILKIVVKLLLHYPKLIRTYRCNSEMIDKIEHVTSRRNKHEHKEQENDNQ